MVGLVRMVRWTVRERRMRMNMRNVMTRRMEKGENEVTHPSHLHTLVLT